MELVVFVCEQCRRRFYLPQEVAEKFCSPSCEADHKLVAEKKR